MMKNTLIIVVGPTASGKSELAVQIAKHINGEIISADSRQIYKGMDIGSGKVEGTWKKVGSQKLYLYKNVPHYLIDGASPRVQYSVARFQKNANVAIQKIMKRGKVPILCGGTGHWIDSVAFEQHIPFVPPDHKLRRQLQRLTPEQLFIMLQKLDAARAKTIDAKNPRRLIRALEIVMSTGKPVPKMYIRPKYRTIWIGINPNQKALEERIKQRLQERLQRGMITEVKDLHEAGISWKKLEAFGLEYKFCALLLQENISEAEFNIQLYTSIRQYAKRQKTWWKKNAEIHWFEDADTAFNRSLKYFA